MRRGALAIVLLGAAISGLPPASAADAARGPILAIEGGADQRLDICGAPRVATVLEGPQVRARTLSPWRGRTRRRARTVLRVHRCTAGAQRLVFQRRLGQLRGAQTVRLPISAPGDYRVAIHSVARRGRRSVVRRPAFAGRRGHHSPAIRSRASLGRRIVVRRRAVYLRVQDPPASVPVEFRVLNVNRSALPCSSDGKPYTLRGRLIGPRAAITGRGPVSAATVYVHEFSFGEFFWSYPQMPAYDYAAHQARAGHVSVVFDRLGYDASDHPPGNDTCLGAQADIVHQVIQQLRAGMYVGQGGVQPRFGRIALAGHSVGGGISELVAYSFGGIDALLLFNWADQGFTPISFQNAFEQGSRCTAGGEPAEPGEPGDYSHFVQDDAQFRHLQFFDAEPAAADAIVRLRNRDPCGDNRSLAALPGRNSAGVGQVNVPVAIFFGRESLSWDADSAAHQQRQLFGASPEVTVELIDRARHVLPFERTAPQLRAKVASWLEAHGF